MAAAGGPDAGAGLAVLAEILPGASLATVDVPAGESHPWSGEPAAQTGPGYRLAIRVSTFRGEAVSLQPGGTLKTVLAWNQLPVMPDSW